MLFETNRRKLQLTHRLSLAQTAPVEFQRFRQTGVLPFSTQLADFDRRFPGHYLRLIRQVRTSIVALVPPSLGIQATLMNSGISRLVVSDGGAFTTVTMVRPTEMVALTSSSNANGLFDLDVQPELLLPFEGTGVDSRWELRLPAAANPFDFRSIADILLTLEYTALNDANLGGRVVRQLLARTNNALSVSLRNDFPDEWYTLVSQAQDPQPPASPLAVQLKISPDSFPPNYRNPTLRNLNLMMIRRVSSPPAFTVSLDHDAKHPGLSATAVTDVISTRSGSGASWLLCVFRRRRTPVSTLRN